MSTRGQSAIWYHFTRNCGEEKKALATCCHCQSTLSITGGSTGNLIRHLKVKHPEQVDSGNGRPGEESESAGDTTSKQKQREEESTIHCITRKKPMNSQNLQSLILSVTEEENNELAIGVCDDEKVVDMMADEEPNIQNGGDHLDSSSSDAHKVGKLSWSDQEIQQLLNLRLPMHSQFQQSSDKQHLWGVVAKRLVALGIGASGRDCDRQWRRILNIYRASRLQANKNGVNSLVWPYFQCVDKVVSADDDDVGFEDDDDDVGSGSDKECEPRLQNADSSRPTWNDQQTRHLLSFRLPLEAAFRQGKNKLNMWPQIAKKMQSMGWEVEAEDCSVKWRNLVRTYKKIRNRTDKQVKDKVTWPYFRALDNAFSNQDESRGSQAALQQQLSDSESDPHSVAPLNRHSKRRRKGSPVTFPPQSRRRLSASESDDCSQPSLSSRCKRLLRHSPVVLTASEAENDETDAPSWFLLYTKEQNCREEQRWREFVQLEREKQRIERDKLQAIEALTKVLNRLVDKG